MNDDLCSRWLSAATTCSASLPTEAMKPVDTQPLEEEFVKLIEADTDAALQLITGMFVGLTLEYMRRRGHDPSGEIKIQGGHQRDITIHAAEPVRPNYSVNAPATGETMSKETQEARGAVAGRVEQHVRPPAEISPDGREVWEWAGKLSERVHLTDELRRAKEQLHTTLNTCGSCARWMTRGCPREKRDNRTGRSSGPSCGAIKCNEFVMSPLNAKTAALAEAKIAELRRRLQAA